MGKEDVKSGMSRRDFFKGAGLAAGGIGTMALLGTVSQTSASAINSPNADSAMPEGVAPIAPISPPGKWDYQTDVVVIGTGGAGGAATVAALEAGAQVITLEKNSIWGGHIQFSIVWGVSNPPPSPDVFYSQNVMAPNSFSPKNPAILGMMANSVADDVQWVQNMGVTFETGPADGEPAGRVMMPVDTTYVEPSNPTPQQQRWYQWFPFSARGFSIALKARAEALKANIMYSTKVTAFVQSGGAVVGVQAQTANGGTIYIKCKSLVMATGGYQANANMLKYYWPSSKLKHIGKYSGLPGSVGDGHRMAQGMGAILDSMDMGDIWDGGVYDPEIPNGPRAFYTAAQQLNRQASLSVNKLGKRFFNEALMPSGALFDYQGLIKNVQPDSVCITILDSTCITRDGILSAFNPAICEYPTPWFEKDFNRQLAAGIIQKADTIAGVAQLVGVDATTLQNTVDRYNALCAKGHDDDFFKDAKYLHPLTTPPYYVTQGKGGALFLTWGGVKLDENMRVLDQNWAPISGLYAAGEVAEWFASIANIIPTGRMAGTNAAKAALGR